MNYDNSVDGITSPGSVASGPAPSRKALTLPSVAMFMALPSAYFITAVVAMAVSGHSGNVAPVWVAGAILAAALIRHEVSAWPALLALAGVAEVAANMLMGSPIAVTLLVAPLGLLEPLIVASGMRRFKTEAPWYGSVHNLSLLALLIVASSVGVSLVGSLGLAYLGVAPFAESWRLWAVADALGLFIVIPFLLSWSDDGFRKRISVRKAGELITLSICVGVAATLIFTTSMPIAFLIFPFLALLTLRTGLSGASAGVLILAGVGANFTMRGMGPIARFPGLDVLDQIDILQLYLFASTLTTLPIAVILAQRKGLTSSLRRQAAISEAALQNMAQGLSMFDAEQRLITCNSRYSELYELPDHLSAPGTPHREIITERMRRVGYQGTFEEYCAENDIDHQRTNGTTDYHYEGRCIEVHRRPLPNQGWVATHADVTERRAAEAHIAYLASHDTLTGLANRASFAAHLEAATARAKRGDVFALHTIDLDRFKDVNDTLGHGVGDQLLKLVAARLVEAVREGDLVARLGGDEFAILQHNLQSGHDAGALAARIVQLLSEPYRFDGYHVLIGATVGIALAPRDALTGPELLKKGDLALYKAKATGRGSIRFFEPGMDARLQERRTLERDLQAALLAEEFELYYQPILSLRTNSICGFEALIRWHHPLRGLLQPGDFITTAEESGLIIPIGEWVLREACREAETWPDELKVAVNLSSVQFRRGDLLTMVTSAVTMAGLDPERLELELTETAILQDEDSVRAVLRQLRSLGISLAMDDFGTGYSSMSYLRSFPFNKIKIDRSFVSELDANGDSLAIVQATIGLAGKMGLVATAEGVETAQQAEALRREGCDELQGYYIGRPLPAHHVSRVVADFEGKKPPTLRVIS